MINNIIMVFDVFLAIHLFGLIIGLGFAMVVDYHAFLGRKSVELTQVCLKIHKTTKPIIWFGLFLIIFSWFFLINSSSELVKFWKSFFLICLVINGFFLSFFISPRVLKFVNKKELISNKLKPTIMLGVLISFVSWWMIFILTVIQLS